MVSISLFALTGVLDQLPDVIDSARNVREAWDRFKNKDDETAQPGDQRPPADDEEPSTAAWPRGVGTKPSPTP